MKPYIITTDNGSDLGKDLIKNMGINLINLTVNVNGKEYDNVENEIDIKKLYEMMKKGYTPSTSQVNINHAEMFFEKFLQQNLDVIHICLSSQISGTYNNCKIAAANLQSKYPDRKIEVIDSISACGGQGLLVLQAYDEQAKGKNFDDVVKFIQNRKNYICHIFTVDDLAYLQRGGRISKTEVIVGSFLGIKPILSCDSHGKLVPIFKSRGRKNALINMVNKLEEIIDIDNNTSIVINHADCKEDAKFVAKLIHDKISIKDILIENLGPVIGSHAGPGTLAIFFVATHRLDKN